MVVYSATITPHESKENWYRLTLTSEKAAWGLGQTKIELIVSESTLRILRNQINQITGEQKPFDLFGEK